MQATIATYDDFTGAGAVLFDDGVEVPFSADAWTGSHLRHLRPGQRVIVQVDDGPPPYVTELAIH